MSEFKMSIWGKREIKQQMERLSPVADFYSKAYIQNRHFKTML